MQSKLCDDSDLWHWIPITQAGALWKLCCCSQRLRTPAAHRGHLAPLCTPATQNRAKDHLTAHCKNCLAYPEAALLDIGQDKSLRVVSENIASVPQQGPPGRIRGT